MNSTYINKFKFFFLVGLVTGLSHSAYAASFDCTKAISRNEKLICTDTELSQLDSELGILFQEKKSTKPKLIHEQKKWLHDQRNTCQEITCLKAAYIARIQEIKIYDMCVVSENSLLGNWVRIKNGFFEEMKFSVDKEKKMFLSWMHHRPEMSGTWEFSQCVISIKDTNNQSLQFDFKVEKVEKNRLYVFDIDSNVNAIYEKN